MFTNPEINASDAFVAAFLPGTEGGGVADLLIADKDGKPRFDFKGRLSFSWPKSAIQAPQNIGMVGYDPQFAYGYGLSYAFGQSIGILSEDSGLSGEGIVNLSTYYHGGKVHAPWRIELADKGGAHPVAGMGDSLAYGVSQRVIDGDAQESARRLEFSGRDTATMRIVGAPIDLSRQVGDNMVITLRYRLEGPLKGPVIIGVGESATALKGGDIAKLLGQAKVGQWATLSVPLSCFKDLGVDMSKVSIPFALSSKKALKISYDSVKLTSNDMGIANCPKS